MTRRSQALRSPQGITEPRAGRAVAALTEHAGSIPVRTAERNRNDVVDLQLRGEMRDAVEARADVAVRLDVGVEERFALRPAPARALSPGPRPLAIDPFGSAVLARQVETAAGLRVVTNKAAEAQHLAVGFLVVLRL